jgi:hypothetical protein
MIRRLRIRKLAVLVIAILVNGCVMPTVPKEKYIPPVNNRSEELALVYVYRVKAFFGSGSDIDILVDGKFAGEIGNGESLSFRVVPGAHTVGPYDWNSPSQAPLFTYGKLGNSIQHEFLAGAVYYIRWKPRSIKEPDAEIFQFTDETMHSERR